MNNLPDINTSPSTARTGKAPGLKSAKNSSNDVFQSILNSIGRNNGNTSWVSNLYADSDATNTSKSGFNSILNNMNSSAGISGKNSLNRSQKNSLNPDDLIVPASLQNQLVAFLQKQGFSLKDINEVISGSKNTSGFIQLDKLLAGLSGINQEGAGQGDMLVSAFKDSFSSFLNEQGIDTGKYCQFFSGIKGNDHLSNDTKNSSFIEASQIPAASELLFKIGVGAGDVKKIIEKCITGNGELDTGKLSTELNKLLTAPISESDLVAFFSKNNISVNKRIFNTADSKNGTRKLSDPENLLADKVQKELKQNIDSALGKGEGKAISEVLGDRTKDASSGDVKSFPDRFGYDLNKTDMGQDGNYLKSVLLNGKASGQLKSDQSQPSSDQGNLKLNLTELIKLAEKKANTDIPVKSAEENIQSAGSAKDSSTGKDSTSFIVKDTSTPSGLTILQENGIKDIGKVNQTNETVNLPQPIPKIVDKILFMIRTGEYQSRLQITPPELGKLDIDLTIKNGHIHANLSTENAAVKEIIQANLNQLKNQLSNQGYFVDRFDVMVGLGNGNQRDSNAWAEGRNGRSSGRNTGSRSIGSVEIPVPPPAGSWLINDSQIDVHV